MDDKDSKQLINNKSEINSREHEEIDLQDLEQDLIKLKQTLEEDQLY